MREGGREEEGREGVRGGREDRRAGREAGCSERRGRREVQEEGGRKRCC